VLTTGGAGAVFGAAVALPGALVHPFTVVVTVKIPAVLTVMFGLVDPLLHNKEPVASVDKLEVPLQLSMTLTTGVDGLVLTVTVTALISEHPVAATVPLM